MARDPSSTWTDDVDGAEPSVDERYEERQELGRGGLGRVVAVYDRVLGRLVARKILLTRGGGPQARRFAREARITARLEHPVIVPVHDVGEDDEGTPWYTMRMVRGHSLQEAIDTADDLADRLTLLDPFRDVCNAIAYAHSRGILHRDLKPANVMIGEYGETWLVDWGLAIAAAMAGRDTETEESEAPPLDVRYTRAGGIVGTPQWMSPEQARGRDADGRADIWGLGALLYAILSGKPPYEGELDDVLDAAAAGRPRPVRERAPSAPPALCAVVDRAMARKPADRYGSASELAAEVAAWRDGRPVQAHEYTLLEVLALRVRREPWWVALVAILLVASAAGVMAWVESARAAGAHSERLAAEAVHRVHDWDMAQAEAAAAQALVLQPKSTRAMGALAGSRAAGRPELVGAFGTEPCRSLVFGEGVLACGTGQRIVVFRDGEPYVLADVGARVQAVRDGRVWARNAGQEAVYAWDIDSGSRLDLGPGILVVPGPAGTWARFTPEGMALGRAAKPIEVMGGLPGDAHFLDPDRVLVMGLSGHLVVVEDGVRHLVSNVPVALRYAMAVAADETVWLPDDEAGVLQLELVRLHDDDGRYTFDARVLRRIPARGPKLATLALSPDERWLAAGDEAGTVTLFDLAGGQVVSRIGGHGQYANVAWTAEGLLATSGGRVDRVRTWRMPQEVERRSLGASAPQALWLDAASGFLHLTDHRTGHEILNPQTLWPVDGVEPLALKPGRLHGARPFQGGLLMLGNDKSRFELIDVNTGAVVRQAAAPKGASALHGVSGVVFVTDLRGRLLGRVGPDLGMLEADETEAFRGVYASDDLMVFQVDRQEEMVRVVLADGSIRHLEGHDARVREAARLGHWLVTGSWDGTAIVWDTTDWSQVAVLEGHGVRLKHLVALSDQRLLTVDWDGGARFWDLSVIGMDPDVLHAEARTRTGLVVGTDGKARPE